MEAVIVGDHLDNLRGYDVVYGVPRVGLGGGLFEKPQLYTVTNQRTGGLRQKCTEWVSHRWRWWHAQGRHHLHARSCCSRLYASCHLLPTSCL